MWFYLSVVGLGLLAWIIFSALTGAASLTFSILGLVAFVVILIAIRRGYIRGRKKEMFFVVGLILLYGMRTFVRGIVVGVYNFLYGIVVTQLNNRSITHIDITKSQWNPNNTGTAIFDLILFFVGAIVLYAMTSSMRDPLLNKDFLGAVVGGLGAALFLTYGFLLLQPYIGNSIYQSRLLEGTAIKLPPVKLPELRVQSDPNTPPLQGWDRWLPLSLLLLITIYVVYFVFLKPPTKTGAPGSKPTLDLFSVVGVAAVLAIAWLFAAGLPFLK